MICTKNCRCRYISFASVSRLMFGTGEVGVHPVSMFLVPNAWQATLTCVRRRFQQNEFNSQACHRLQLRRMANVLLGDCRHDKSRCAAYIHIYMCQSLRVDSPHPPFFEIPFGIRRWAESRRHKSITYGEPLKNLNVHRRAAQPNDTRRPIQPTGLSSRVLELVDKKCVVHRAYTGIEVLVYSTVWLNRSLNDLFKAKR